MKNKNEKIMLLLTILMFAVSVLTIMYNTEAIKDNKLLEQRKLELHQEIVNLEMKNEAYRIAYNQLQEKYNKKIENDNNIKWVYYNLNSTIDFSKCFDELNYNGTLNWSYFNSTKCTLISQ